MGFRKKNGKPSNGTPESADKPAVAATPAESPKKAKKKGVGMASLFTETVPEQVLDELNSNTPFILDIDGEKKYIAVQFTAEAIGGLDKKTSAKDEAKGQLVQQLDSGAISAYFTAQTLEDEEITFIPNSTSLMNVEEFGLVRNLPWTFVIIDGDGTIEKTSIKTGFDEVKEILEGKKNIDDVFEGAFVGKDIPTNEAPADEVKEEPELTDIDSIPSEIVDDVPEGDSTEEDTEDDEVPAFEEELPDVGGDMPLVEVPEYDDVPETSDYDDIGGLDEGEAPEETEETTDIPYDEDRPFDYDAKSVNEEIIRRFYSDELGLEVSTEPFDGHYVHGNKYLPFEENRPEGWLNNYLNEMCRNANIEMSRIHAENLNKIRQYYLQTMAKHCEDITKELDVQNMSTTYGQYKQNIDREKEEAIAHIDDKVAQRKLELNQDWDRKLSEVAEQGAQDARNRYRERYGRQHDDDLTHIGPIIREEIESNYTLDVRHLNEDRKAEALKRLDYAVNETLAEVNVLYEKLLAEEIKRYREWEGDIRDYLDDNRKNDVAHDQALAEELAQKTKADKLNEEWTAKTAAMTEEFEAKKASLHADLERMEKEHALALKKQNDDWQEKLDSEKSIVASQREQIDGLIDKYAALDETKKKEYASVINELKNEKEASDSKYKDMMESNKSSNRVALFATIIGVICALAIGFLAGYFVYAKMSAKTAEEQVIAEYQARIDELERKYNLTTGQNATDATVTVTPAPTGTTETTTETSEATSETTN